MMSTITDKAVGSWSSPSKGCPELSVWHWLLPQKSFFCIIWRFVDKTGNRFLSGILTSLHSQWIYIGRHTSQEPRLQAPDRVRFNDKVSAFRTCPRFIAVSESLVISLHMYVWCVCVWPEADVFLNTLPSFTWTQNTQIWLVSLPSCSRDPVSFPDSWDIGGFATFMWVLGIWTLFLLLGWQAFYPELYLKFPQITK